MFFKVIYYLIGLLIVMYKAVRISQPEKTKEFWEIWRWHEEAKENGTQPTSGDEWKDSLGDMFQPVIVMAIFAVIEFGWLTVGLFSYNWLLFMAFMVYSFSFNRIMKGRLKKYQSVFVSSTNRNLFIGICVILFAFINTFHLHIELFKFIFGG